MDLVGAGVRDDSASAGRLRQEPFDERSAWMAIQAVQLELGEKIDVCTLLRREGQIQANDQDVVLATPRLGISRQGDLRGISAH